jgi:hypothetical protein
MTTYLFICRCLIGCTTPMNRFTMDAIRRAPNNESAWNFFSSISGEAAITKDQVENVINFAQSVFKV